MAAALRLPVPEVKRPSAGLCRQARHSESRKFTPSGIDAHPLFYFRDYPESTPPGLLRQRSGISAPAQKPRKHLQLPRPPAEEFPSLPAKHVRGFSPRRPHQPSTAECVSGDRGRALRPCRGRATPPPPRSPASPLVAAAATHPVDVQTRREKPAPKTTANGTESAHTAASTAPPGAPLHRRQRGPGGTSARSPAGRDFPTAL